ncbi:uncharacterized conserved protein (plasmid) [Borrelia recurrentis A1]|uniref:Uncharacterized conserved protein n=1 Tax=Borrelia recurrentis (strain A1) TaxID=412418 RepID=B5RRZ9_BORRA|nr:hypothetical protein [Borrelia recurrentis]ACH95135.1 uncharacterized conserved protein [Borrelia recurrentis A1]
MVFKNKELKYSILFKSNLSISDIAKVLGVRESTVLKAKINILGEVASDLNNFDTNACVNFDLDALARDATCQAYMLEKERDSFYKSFYKVANSYINSHFKYKQIIINSDLKRLITLNEEILKLTKDINNNDKDLCKKLKLDLRYKIYKKNRLSKKIILNEMKEDYGCLLKLKKIFNSKGLKLE